MPVRRLLIALLCTLPVLSGCATLQQFRALDRVDFSIGGISRVRLAGIDLWGVDSFADLGLVDAARLASAAQRRDLPLAFEIAVLAENPVDNVADARLVGMDWTLLLEDRETLSGSVGGETLLRRGQPTTIPIAVSLNLVEFFEGNARDLFELALSFTGAGGAAKQVTLRALPVIETPFGPIAYPEPITIVSREVG
jgi:hypothetical protein